MNEPAPPYTELPQQQPPRPDPLAGAMQPMLLDAPPTSYLAPASAVRSHEEPPDATEALDETAAVNANLENWSSAETQRRRSVRQARRAEALSDIVPTRRISMRRHARAQRPEGSAALVGLVAANDDLSSPAPSLGAVPNTHDSLPRTSPSGPNGTSLGEPQEVDMLRQPRARSLSQDLNLHSPQSSQGSAKPQPTRARPIVTAGPAPVRDLWAKDSAAERATDNAALTVEEQAHQDEIKEELAADSKRSKRGFWLTDLLCCKLGSAPEEEQAGKTNPNE